MTLEEAKRLVVREWDDWAAANLDPSQEASGTHGLVFYVYLEQNHPELLKFPARGDRWQTVHGWLLQEGKVGD